MTDSSGLYEMWKKIPVDTGIPDELMKKARPALAYAMTAATEGDAEVAVAIIAKAIQAERERCAQICEDSAERFRKLSVDRRCLTDWRWDNPGQAKAHMLARAESHASDASDIRRGAA